MCKFWREVVPFGGMAALFFLAAAVSADFAPAGKKEVEAFFGTDRVKAVFVSDSRLYFIDFSEAAPQLKVIGAARTPVNPVISPNGGRVAYASGNKLGNDAPTRWESAAWICDIAQDATPALIDSPAFVPRFIQNAPQHTIVFSDSGCGDSASMVNHPWNGCGRVWKKNIVTNEKAIVWDKGSWYGGLSYDGKWLATAEGLMNAFLINITEPVPVPRVLHSLRLKVAATGKDTLLGFQTCNPSVSSSRIFPDAIMYLDIAVSASCGTKYTVPGFGEDAGWDNHTRIFIARSSGNIAKAYRAPEGGGKIAGTAWAYPEWSNHPYYAAAALEIERYWIEMQDVYPSNERLYAINLHDSTYFPLVTQKDTALANLKKQSIKWPWLWVETPDTFAGIEDKTWLDGSMGAVHPSGSPWKKRGRLPFTVKNGFLCLASNDIVEVKLFTLAGGLVQTVRPYPEQRGISLASLPGTIVVACAEKTGRRLTGVVVNSRR